MFVGGGISFNCEVTLINIMLHQCPTCLFFGYSLNPLSQASYVICNRTVVMYTIETYGKYIPTIKYHQKQICTVPKSKRESIYTAPHTQIKDFLSCIKCYSGPQNQLH